MKPRILIIEDDEAIRSQLKWALAEDYEVLLAQDRVSAVDTFRTKKPEVALLDLGLPPHIDDPSEGLAVLTSIRSLDRSAKVIVVSGLTGREAALRAVGEGAHDFLHKPVEIAELRSLVRHCQHVAALEREYQELQQDSRSDTVEVLVGDSLLMKEVFACIRKVAATHAQVLILGESGSGKETAARAIHRQSDRSGAPFMAIDCDALPEDLIESELFGQETDPITGTHLERPGRIELAAGGTLFLDAVGELPPCLQVKLLRFLQDQVVERVGGRESICLDTRIIAGANADLTKDVPAAKFRGDLYYRLAVVVIRMPALREHKEDIRLLAQAFLQRFAAQYGKQAVRIDPAALRTMEQYSWPGNVRELENCVRRAVILSEGDCLHVQDFDVPAPTTPAEAGDLRGARQNAERETILRALRRHHDKISPAAEELGISRPTFYALMAKLGIQRSSNPPETPDLI